MRIVNNILAVLGAFFSFGAVMYTFLSAPRYVSMLFSYQWIVELAFCIACISSLWTKALLYREKR